MGAETGLTEIMISGSLIAILIFVSRFLKLGLGKDLAIAAFRAAAQLALIGFVLQWVFTHRSAWITLLLFVIMTLIAAQATTSRLKRRGSATFLIALSALAMSVWPTGLFALWAFLGNGVFTDSARAIPFLGLLLGNALTAISLTLAGLERADKENAEEVLTLRALGASRWESLHRLYREIVRASFTPILNGMTIVGVVSLPGVMAGQLLAGENPLSAARFQIVVMFLIAFASMAGALATIAIHHTGIIGHAISWKGRRHARSAAA